MSIKIIAKDLDGTLMAPDHMSITDRTMAALIKAHEKGVKLAISKGRTLSLIKNVWDMVPFIDYIIYSDGASVYDCNAKKDVFREHIPADKTQKIIEIFNRHPMFFNVYNDGKIYMKKMYDESFRKRASIPEDFFNFYIKNTVPCKDIQKEFEGKSAELCVAYLMDEECKKEIISFMESIGGLSYMSSIMNNIEIVSSKAGKGSALKAICEINGFTAAEAMSFGDALNDCSMLEYASYSFAMANGNDACKKTAKYITDSNAEDGVAKMIEKYVLNE